MTKKELNIIVGKNIRLQRVSKRLSTIELASLLDLSPAFVNLMEQGRRGVTSINLFKLSEIFNVEIGDFYIENPKDLTIIKKDTSLDESFSTIRVLLFDLSKSELNFIESVIKDIRLLRRVE